MRASTATAGNRFRNFWTASPRTSSAASGCLVILAWSLPMRVMESRFSTTRISHWASSRTSVRRAVCSSLERAGLSRTVEVAPTMEVRGVRMSWDTERSRSARIFTFSFSIRRRSCSLAWEVRALVTRDTTRKVRIVSG